MQPIALEAMAILAFQEVRYGYKGCKRRPWQLTYIMVEFIINNAILPILLIADFQK